MPLVVQSGTVCADALIQRIVRTLGVLIVPAAVLLLVHRLSGWEEGAPAQLIAFKAYAPYAALALSAFISAWFNRNRAFLALVCLSTAYFSYCALLSAQIDSDLVARVFTLLCVVVPLNLAALAVLPERGLFNSFGLRRLLLVALQVGAICLVLNARFTDLPDWLSAPLPELDWLHAEPIPPRIVPMMLFGVLVVCLTAMVRDGAIEKGLGGAIVAFALACYSAERPPEFGLLATIAALLIMISVLHESFRMAFRDELTGLPNRRALNERMMSLGDRFSIAMLDIDHFKGFNDTYGHIVGDDVLKMVAAKLQKLGAGGRAFRYGGEEFALIFPAHSPRRVLRELESLRMRIAEHRLALRSSQRPAQAKLGRSLRTSKCRQVGLSVTVSIGLAQSDATQRAPEQVLQAADSALYRAKGNGRNCVSN